MADAMHLFCVSTQECAMFGQAEQSPQPAEYRPEDIQTR